MIENILENITIRDATHDDFSKVIRLYENVKKYSKEQSSTKFEIEPIEKVFKNSINQGIFLIIETKDTEEVIGEVHGHKLEGSAVSHVMGEFGFIIDPRFHGKNLGQALVNIFLTIIKKNHPYILRVEIMVRETNTQGIDFYKSFDFVQEGRHLKRFRHPDGALENELSLVWFNPAYRERNEIL